MIYLSDMKKGLIRISNEMYIKRWEYVYIFLKDFIITHIDYRHWENNTWYLYGISDFFDELNEGDTVPEYTVTFTIDKNDKLTYSFNRV